MDQPLSRTRHLNTNIKCRHCMIRNIKEPSDSGVQIQMRKRWDFIRHKQSLCLRNGKEQFRGDLVNTKLIGCHVELQIRGFEIALVANIIFNVRFFSICWWCLLRKKKREGNWHTPHTHTWRSAHNAPDGRSGLRRTEDETPCNQCCSQGLIDLLVSVLSVFSSIVADCVSRKV